MLKKLTTHIKNHGFTLIEIIVTVVIVGVIGTLALNNYNKIIEQGRCRNAQLNIIRILNAAKVKYIKTGSTNLAPGVFQSADINFINSNLGIEINDPFFTYQYWSAGSGYTCRATRIGLGYFCTQIGGAMNPIGNSTCNNSTYCSAIL